MSDKELPDDFADNPQKYDHSIEKLAGAPDGPQIMSEGQKKDKYIAELENLHRQRDTYQGEVNIAEMDEYFRDNAEIELDHFIGSEEGRKYTTEKLAQDGRRINEGQSGPNSDEVYAKGHKGYLARKADREKERGE